MPIDPSAPEDSSRLPHQRLVDVLLIRTTWTAECYDGGGNTSMTVFVESSEADAFTAGPSGFVQPVSPGSRAKVFGVSDPDPDPGAAGSLYAEFPLSAVAPSGAEPLGQGFAGVNVAGADCVLNGILWP
jgi:hypothetical protein